MKRKPSNTTGVTYTGRDNERLRNDKKSIKVIGLDTEADANGKCFMIATSLGDVWQPKDFPECLIGRKYRSANFVAYNLKYDEGALLQGLPIGKLDVLRTKLRTQHKGWSYRIIPHKCLTISRNKNSATFYDLLNFFHMSLEKAASTYLDEHKIDFETKTFTPDFIVENWERLAAYCVQDAVLVQRLAEFLIAKFEDFGVYPKRLFSVAYVSYEHFRRRTDYPTVKRYWEKHRYVLDMAMEAYNGGKFEVTRKGIGYYYEYDIVSAYPKEIRDMIDIRFARVVRSPEYRRQAVYGFLRCTIKVPYACFSPTVVKRGEVNTYPVGEYRRTITKTEYDFLVSNGADIQIHDACWLHVTERRYPFRTEIDRLLERKQDAKRRGDKLDYHTAKILMNSLYGKFVQLIDRDERWIASSCWNPIYGSVITGNVRVRIAAMQNMHHSIVAVHTDSVISTEPLPFGESDTLGDFAYETEGEGLILGSGVYQIGDKIALRGFPGNFSLFDYVDRKTRRVKIPTVRPLTWREVAFHGWDTDRINRFEDQDRYLDCQFDHKRIWLDDWERWSDIRDRTVSSVPLVVCPVLF